MGRWDVCEDVWGGGDWEQREGREGGSCCLSGLEYLYGGGKLGEEDRFLILKSRGTSDSRGTGGPGYVGGDTGGLIASLLVLCSVL